MIGCEGDILCCESSEALEKGARAVVDVPPLELFKAKLNGVVEGACGHGVGLELDNL